MNVLDELSDALATAEHILISREFGVEASTPMGNEDDLFFGRLDKEWCLYVQRPTFEPIPLMESSVERRILAAHALNALWLELEREACERDVRAKVAAKAAHSFCAKRGSR